ncbi:MAG: KOW motif-containing protein, partial [Oscillospiraceae bacterium]|nr:KOW motif-containing protein [Oscillospiraceae bacterium]
MKAAENRNMLSLIQEVNIPLETVTEHTDAGEKTYERKIYPGYVLVKMILTDESWHLVRNVRGATGFVGNDGKAIPLTQREIYDMGLEKREGIVPFAAGDLIKIVDGPLEGFEGKVEEIDPDGTHVRVTV